MKPRKPFCNRCNILKNIDNTYTNKLGSFHPYCKKCAGLIAKEKLENDKIYRDKRHNIAKKFRQTNKEKCKDSIKKCYEKNKPQYLLKSKQWHTNNKEKTRLAHLKYNNNNKEKRNAYLKEYRKKTKCYIITNIDLKIKHILRTRLYMVTKYKGIKKHTKTMDLVGCSMLYLKEHLSSQFTDGMSWENYGLYGWHIDHIIPCASFDLTDPEQQKKCFHYTNLQPLWASDNLSKGDRLDWVKPSSQ